MKRNWLRPTAFSLMGIVIVLLIVATIIEKVYGTEVAMHYIYKAPWSIALWGIAAISGITYFVMVMKQGGRKHLLDALPTWGIHFSFIIILLGALVTHIWGESGHIHLRMNEESNIYIVGNETRDLPFNIKLTDFHIDYYPGTSAPMDYISSCCINDGEKVIIGNISMNNIFQYRHYRFYQSKYDTDAKGTTYSISHDPWGIGITYAGYLLLLMSMLTFFFSKRTHFRALLKEVKVAAMTVLLALCCVGVNASESKVSTPHVLQRGLAKSYGNLYVYYNNRVCPMSTLAHEFCQKVYGGNGYNDYSAEQVLTGFLFHYDEWKQVPIIKVKKSIQKQLGINGKYASLNDFYDINGYKLEQLLKNGNKDARSADEKVQLIAMVATGSIFRIWPIKNGDTASLQWYSWIDNLPKELGEDDWRFCSGAMDYAAMLMGEGKNVATNEVFVKIKSYQEKKAGIESLPSEQHFKAEQFYQRLPYTKPLAIGLATLGILLFIIYCIGISGGHHLPNALRIVMHCLLGMVWLFLTGMIALRWYVSGHVPLANGFETMQFLAWSTALITLLIGRRIRIAMPVGYLVCGMTLMVSMMSASNPQITNLMPVLQSPLLSIHVCIIMIAYCLLAFIMLNGVAALVIGAKNGGQEVLAQSQCVSTLLLYPAVFCLTIGIFIGAVWANVSWGRYWGWDPKEVWALITMLIYSAPLHSSSLKAFKNPTFFHVYCIVAFLSVLITYFGVNFLLGGMHSYA